MNLSADQVALINESYAQIVHKPGNYSALFYHRLFERHPFARSLFPDDMAHQVNVFRSTLDALVNGIDDLASLQSTLAELARRHVQYGVTARHYAFVGEVLIDTFEEILGPGFAGDTRKAWEKLYADTASVMVNEAYPRT